MSVCWKWDKWFGWITHLGCIRHHHTLTDHEDITTMHGVNDLVVVVDGFDELWVTIKLTNVCPISFLNFFVDFDWASINSIVLHNASPILQSNFVCFQLL
jgi:hypothetical protein